MPFCNYCGRELRDGDRFCVACGREVVSSAETKSQETVIHKCPNCGETIPEFAIRCVSCGYELRDVQKKSEVTRFLEKLNTLGDGISGAERKAKYIRDFSVPNTKDETIEFLAHASTCIDTRLISKANPTKAEMKRSEYKAQTILTQAWLEKFEEVYNRAEKEYADDPTFQQIRNISDQKHRDVKRAERAKRKENGCLHNGCIMFIATGLVIGALIFAGILIVWAIRK